MGGTCRADSDCYLILYLLHLFVMRRYNVLEPYEKLKELTRGRVVTKEHIREFIEGLELPKEAKTDLMKLTSHSYVSAAVELAKTDSTVYMVNGTEVFETCR